MAKQAAKDQEKFVVRLPEGMRERIKAKADRAGMSMNEAIVWCLEQHFPAPKTLEAKLDELAEMVAILKGDDTYQGVQKLVDEVQKTVYDVYKQNLKTPPDFEKAVSDRYEKWSEWAMEQINDDAYDPFDDENYPNFPSDEELQAYAQQREDYKKKTARMIEIAEKLEAEEKANNTKK